jgi:hypothetical protein
LHGAALAAKVMQVRIAAGFGAPAQQREPAGRELVTIGTGNRCSILLLALMESAGWLLNRLHALRECCVRQGFASHGLDLFRHHRMCA